MKKNILHVSLKNEHINNVLKYLENGVFRVKPGTEVPLHEIDMLFVEIHADDVCEDCLVSCAQRLPVTVLLHFNGEGGTTAAARLGGFLDPRMSQGGFLSRLQQHIPQERLHWHLGPLDGDPERWAQVIRVCAPLLRNHAGRLVLCPPNDKNSPLREPRFPLLRRSGADMFIDAVQASGIPAFTLSREGCLGEFFFAPYPSWAEIIVD